LGIVSRQDEEELKSYSTLQAWSEERLTRAKAGNRYACPFCNSGNHNRANSDSAFGIFKDSNGQGRFKCNACQATGNIFDLAAQVDNLPNNGKEDYKGLLKHLARWKGIATNSTARKNPSSTGTVKDGRTVGMKPAEFEANRKAERAYIAECQKNITEPPALAYLEARGINSETAARFGLGYDRTKCRIIVPWRGCDYYHIDRDITGSASHKYEKPGTAKVGKQPLYNAEALKAESFFVVEGLFDALALELLGFSNVIALAGCAGNQLAEAMLAEPRRGVAILALDRDEEGQKAQAKLASQLEESALPYRQLEFPDTLQGKDADEMRRSDSEAFRAVLSAVKEETEQLAEEERERAYRASLERLKVKDAASVAADVLAMDGVAEPIQTRFREVDKVLGGLPVGLTVIGAISSMGKTTFCLQLADQIAAFGTPVLFVSIEQSARELVAKSVSRFTYMVEETYAATSSELALPKERAKFSDARKNNLLHATYVYQTEVAPNLHIVQGDKQPSVSDIAQVAHSIARHDGRPPVVFVDYLQLLAPQSDRDTDKQATDRNVIALRQLSRDLQTPIVCISSLNRSSYTDVISEESFKESGAIEYGSDLLLGLQVHGIERQLKNLKGEERDQKARSIVEKVKRKPIRGVELKVMKNRAGMIPDPFPIVFDARYSLMVEGEEGSADSSQPARLFDSISQE
jgi:replicative DNA helicase